jgi:hypothetical protein
VLSFAIVASNDGRPLDPVELELFEARGAAEVPFPPVRCVTWSNASRTVWFTGWQAPTAQPGGETHWRVDPDGLTAFVGRVWPRRAGWPGTGPVAAQLARHLQRQPLANDADELAGVYVVASLSLHGSSSVAADPIGAGLLYRGSNGDIVVLSTRAAVAAAILAAADGTAPRRDVLGAGWLPYAGWAMGARTGFERVALVPDGAVVEIGSTGAVALHRSSRPVWHRHGDELAADPEAALDEARAEMTTAIRMALRDPMTQGCLGLTGGKDSRLVLALLLADGTASEIECQTYGDDDLPDVVVARQLANAFGLRHVTRPGASERHAWRRRVDEAARDGGLGHCSSREIAFRIAAWVTSGMTNAGEPEPGRLPSGGRVLLTGLFGESLRTNYHDSTRIRSKTQASRFPDELELGAAEILDREAVARYRAEVHDLLFEGASDADSPQDVIDTFYLRQRLRRWMGGTLEINSENRTFPLYSITGLRLAFAIGAENRHSEWIHHRLIQDACEPLHDIPFAGDRWPPGTGAMLVVPKRHREAVPATPSPQRVRHLARRSLGGLRRRLGFVRAPARRTAAREHRAKVRATDVDVMRSLLRRDALNPAFELIDAGAAQRALDRFPTLTERERLQLYGALTAVIWLGGHEVVLPPGLSAA